ncbi:MAG: AgmX/PglI C-terminal domain-containing protein [Deltaproteobacteria bacterium]|nr:MAG: AgmX/PglI C-terminal domain-containing protein [Deltaproteobacteria bacterium]
MPSKNLHDLAEDAWDDPWGDDEPLAIPEATPQHNDQPTVVGHGLASARVGPPRGSNHHLGEPGAPTAAHARAAALLPAPVIRPAPARPSSAALAATPSAARIEAMPELERTGRSPISRPSTQIERNVRMPMLQRPAVIERSVASQPSRMTVVLLAALLAGGLGAFLVAKATQYATGSDTRSAVASVVATPAAPAAPLAAASPAVVPDPRPSAPSAAVRELPAAPPASAAVEAHPIPPAASEPAGKPAAPATHDDRSDKAKPRPRAAHAAAARPRSEPEPPAEAARPEPRADGPANLATPEPGKPEPAAETVKAPEREPAAPPSIARPEPPAPRAGTIDIAATRAAVRAQIGPVQQCYERAKMDDTSLAGTVVARLAINPDGSVGSVEIVKSTLGAPQVEGCIRQGILRWQLPRPAGGAPASLTYPLVFQ